MSLDAQEIARLKSLLAQKDEEIGRLKLQLSAAQSCSSAPGSSSVENPNVSIHNQCLLCVPGNILSSPSLEMPFTSRRRLDTCHPAKVCKG